MLKLILADNQAIFRAGIAKVLAVEDEMRIVAQAQTPEQMFMALDKFRAAVLIVAGGFQSDFNAIVQGATKNKTRIVVLADTGESAQRYMSNGAHGVVYRNVTSPALVDCVRKVAATTQPVAGAVVAEVCGDAADQHARIDAATRQHPPRQRGGRRLAVRARDDDGPRAP